MDFSNVFISHDGVVVAVRLRDNLDTLQARQATRGRWHGRQNLGERSRRARHERRARILGQQVEQVVAQYRRARSSTPTIGIPDTAKGASTLSNDVKCFFAPVS